MFGDEVEERQEPTFNEAIEKHFEQFDKPEDEEEIAARIELEAMKKFNKIKEDQEKRLKAIQNEIDHLLEKAQLVEKYSSEVQAIIDVDSLDHQRNDRHWNHQHHQGLH